jgi:phospholipid transport system substrate-binding protein
LVKGVSVTDDETKKLKDPDFAKNKTEIRHFVDEKIFPHVDTVRMSALVLGKHWQRCLGY